MDKNLYLSHWYTNHEKIGVEILDWCWDNLGASKFHSYVEPYLSFDEIDNEFLGEYVSSDNEIIIYVDEINDLEEFIQTIIHEYIHYLQSPTWYSRHWNRIRIDFSAGNDYFDHPYEAEAEEVANKYWKVCKMEIEKKSS